MNKEMVRKLAPEQVRAFDVEYVTAERWDALAAEMEHLPVAQERFCFVDLGGGNGVFADKVLDRYPHSTGWVVDNSEYLLAKNTYHPRKVVIAANAADLPQLFAEKSVDIIFLNWFLHHYVMGNFSKTLAAQRTMLNAARSLLSDNGRIIIFENLPDGLFGESLCSYIIFRVTSNKLLAPLVKRMGGNTAGIGICFLGRQQWLNQFGKCDLEVVSERHFDNWKLNPFKKVMLTLKNIRIGLFTLKKRA